MCMLRTLWSRLDSVGILLIFYDLYYAGNKIENIIFNCLGMEKKES